MTQTKKAPGPGQTEAGSGWNPFTGQRVFRSARAAWMVYGQYRFSFTERTFYNYVGKGKACPPRADGQFYIEDIEIIAQSQAWPLASFFVRGAQTGGEGESHEDLEFSAIVQQKKLRKLDIEIESAEIDLRKKRKELLPRSEYEQRLAAAAAVVGTEAETFVYDKVREIIHVCGGEPEKEDSLREYLLKEVRAWLHAFSRSADYDVVLVEDDAEEGSHHTDFVGEDDAAGNLD